MSELDELSSLIQETGARMYFDRGNDCTKPCTFCGTRPAPNHKTVRIGTYPNGDPIRRPVCDQCMPIVEARKPVAKAPPVGTGAVPLCQDCGWPIWSVGADFNFDDTKHCLAAHVRARAGTPNHDLIACLERTRDRLRTQVGGTRQLCRYVLQMLDDGVALIDAGAPLGLREFDMPATTRARIERQDAENHQLKLRLAEKGAATEPEASVMVVVVRPGRCGGQPTIGHTRLPLMAPLGRLRGGDTAEDLARDWPDVPAESWVVLKALHEELQAEVEEENERVY